MFLKHDGVRKVTFIFRAMRKCARERSEVDCKPLPDRQTLPVPASAAPTMPASLKNSAGTR
ncbi:MAG: hypothetical protein LBM04_00175, partial [Opitutaceae bacterium]|nr:hypothetical protein [Opitutaceae bacterium]